MSCPAQTAPPMPNCPGNYPNTSSWEWAYNYQNVRAWDPQYQKVMTLRIADPTILVINDAQGRPTFYLTGTCDDYGQRNFAIYKSRNLQDWCWHFAAFPLNNPQVINGRTFSNMWSPQLYISPNDPDTVYLAFAATEEVPLPDGTGTTREPVAPFESGSCGIDAATESTQYVTSMVCSMPKSNFISPTYHFGSSTASWDDNQPAYYTYTKNNAPGAFKYDGGEFQGPNANIPVTGSMWQWGASCGQADRYVWGFNHRCHQAYTWIGDAPFVGFTHDTKKPYLLYTWTAYTNPAYSLNTVNGNNISMFPMLNDNFLMDAYGAATHIAYRSSLSDLTEAALPAGITRNGLAGAKIINCDVDGDGDVEPVLEDGYPIERCHSSGLYPGGVAEGASLWYEPTNQRYYVFYSRNAWNSSDYMICYRKGSPNTPFVYHRSLGGLTTAFGDEYGEEVLVRSEPWTPTCNDPEDPDHKVHYGNGEIFRAWDKTYLVCHCRVWLNEPGRIGWFRTVYFKELSFDPTTGDIGDLVEYDAGVWGRSMHVFRVPSN